MFLWNEKCLGGGWGQCKGKGKCYSADKRSGLNKALLELYIVKFLNTHIQIMCIRMKKYFTNTIKYTNYNSLFLLPKWRYFMSLHNTIPICFVRTNWITETWHLQELCDVLSRLTCFYPKIWIYFPQSKEEV